MNRYLANIVLSVLFGCLIGFLAASIDRSYHFSYYFSSETKFFLLPPHTLTKEELDLFLFYWIEIVGSGFYGLLAGLAVVLWHNKNRVVLISLVIIFGFVKGVVNFAIAYDNKISRLDVARINDISEPWKKVEALTILHFAAGCLIFSFSVLIWKYWLNKNIIVTNN